MLFQILRTEEPRTVGFLEDRAGKARKEWRRGCETSDFIQLGLRVAKK